MSFPLSDHFNGKTFFNANHENRSWRDVLRWRRTSQPTPWPNSVPLPAKAAPPSPRRDEFVITFIGHATFLIQTTRGNFLTDPHFSKRCGPFCLLGPARVQPPGLPIESLPSIDTVLLSHDHYDHCDLPSLRALAKRANPLLVTPLGNGHLAKRAGLRRIVELDWWNRHAIATDLSVTLTPARHWSNRLTGRRNARLWGGFFVTNGQRTCWFAGDTAYDATLFTEIRVRLGAPDVAMIPIGAYEPRWFMAAQHCDPAEAVEIHRAVGAAASLAMHWGTWQLTDEGRDEPVRQLKLARAAAAVPSERFRVIAAGESVTL